MRPGPRGALVAALALVAAGVAVLPTIAAPARCGGRDATIVGTDGADVLIGTDGADVIAAKGGADVIRARGGDDTICAGAGDDHVTGGRGPGRVQAGPGDDTIVAGSREHTISGNRGNDLFFAAGGTGGRIEGDDGNDWLTFVDRPCNYGVTVDLTEHRVRYGGCGERWVQGRWVVRGIEVTEGSDRGDTLIGNEWRNSLRGQGGADELRGRDANDLLHGGSSSDVGRGGNGTDVCRAVEARYSCEG